MPLMYKTLLFKTEINSDYLQERLYNMLDTTFIIPNTYGYNVVEVDKEYIARPDLISYQAYGDTMYADVICKLNGISNPFELNEGMMLIIPAPEYIDDFVQRPNQLEKEQSTIDGESSMTPSPKKKNEKRKANQAVVDDSRFKIDKASKIVIY